MLARSCSRSIDDADVLQYNGRVIGLCSRREGAEGQYVKGK